MATVNSLKVRWPSSSMSESFLHVHVHARERERKKQFHICTCNGVTPYVLAIRVLSECIVYA